MTRVTLELTGRPLRAVMPVHSRSEPCWRDAVGWFITNSVLESDTPDLAACPAAVKDAITMGRMPWPRSWPRTGGCRPRLRMFALSWLDNRRLPVSLPPGLSPHQLWASIRTDWVMLWLLLNEDGMHVRCRHPDTPEARASMDEWLTAVCAGIRAEVARQPMEALVA